MMETVALVMRSWGSVSVHPGGPRHEGATFAIVPILRSYGPEVWRFLRGVMGSPEYHLLCLCSIA